MALQGKKQISTPSRRPFAFDFVIPTHRDISILRITSFMQDELTGFYMDQLGFKAATPDQAPCYVFTVNVQCDYHDEIAANGLVRGFVRYCRLGRSSAEVSFLLQSDSDSRVLASGKITQVFVDPATRQSIPIPDFFRTNILARQPELVNPE
jgi:Predicted thioesterase